MQFVKAYKPQGYAEDFQSRKCKFAFAMRDGENFKIMVDPVLCRDFLNDTLVWKAKENKPCSIYSYNYKGKIETEDSVLYLYDDDPNGLQDNIGFLNELEREIGIKETQLFRGKFQFLDFHLVFQNNGGLVGALYPLVF
jgi:hypothetical protein